MNLDAAVCADQVMPAEALITSAIVTTRIPVTSCPRRM